MALESNTIRMPSDLGSWVLFPGNSKHDTIYLVGSQKIDKYLTVPAERHSLVLRIFAQLQQGATPAEVEAALRAEGLEVNVDEFCRMLAQKRLLEWESVDSDVTEPSNATFFGQLRALSWQVFSFNLEKLHPILTKLATPLLILLGLLVILSTAGVLAQGWISAAVLRTMARQVLGNRGFLWMALLNLFLIPVFVFFHEAAHALAAAQGGVYPRRLSMRLYLLVMPYFSLQLPGLYTLPLSNRFLTMAAGPLMDLTLGNLCLLTARVVGGEGIAWLALIALNNYGRFLFNILPIMPMTDGYALLSQAIFREIDIRGHATQEFRRWRQKQANIFKGKYVVFYLLNLGVGVFIIAGGLVQVNTLLLDWLQKTSWLPIEPSAWLIYPALGLLNVLGLYLVRKRLRLLVGW